jgi:hypothetical protein
MRRSVIHLCRITHSLIWNANQNDSNWLVLSHKSGTNLQTMMQISMYTF